LPDALGAAGVPGARFYWPLAERLAPWPDAEHLRVAGRVPSAADDFIGSNIYRGLYERAEVRLLPRLLRPGDTFVDVGANVGYYTALGSLLVGPTGRVHAFEPSPVRFARLERLVAAAGLDNATLYRAGVGASTGHGCLYNAEIVTNSGAGTLRSDLAADKTGIDVEVLRLEDVQAISDATEIGLLKVDTEGFEEQVLQGAGPLFGLGRVRFAIIEVSPEFGSVTYAAELVERAETYRAFPVGERGMLRRTTLRPLPAAGVRAAPKQFNMLLARVDAVASVAPFIRRAAPARRTGVYGR
jgi:FkbM family methyltransferase